jgi:hypothetical protein
MDAANPPRQALRILFSMRNFWYVKLFDSVIRELAARGHFVHILAERGEHNDRARDWNEAATALSREHARVTFEWAPRQIEDDWIDLRLMIRLGIDHLRFLEQEYVDAPMLGERARRRAPAGIVRLVERPLFRTRAGRRVVAAALRAAERALPTDPEVAGYVASYPADVILVTPMLTLGSEQVDVLRIARRRGVPTALCVGSWDHLSSKALIREWPDRVFVWNDTQKREAVTLHGVPAERVVVTGAQCFDQWFNRAPALDRRAFCAKVGLDPSRPFILYVCSALFEGSPNEAEFVRRWIAALRSSGDPRVADAGILVRPHPKREFEWDSVDLSDLPHVSLWPPRAAAPFDAETRADYYDSLFHSAAVAGLNTSALIEGGIVGRAVHTILLPEFYENQEGTLHFRYLLDGGLLRAARDLPAHVGQLAASLREDAGGGNPNQAFIEQFVRPHGTAVDATPVFASAVEALGAASLAPAREPAWVPLVRFGLQPVMRRTQGTFAQQVGRARRRHAKRTARDERISALTARRADEKARVVEERQRRQAAKLRERQELQARDRADKLRLKADQRTAKLQRKRRQALKARVASYLQRITHPFSLSR